MSAVPPRNFKLLEELEKSEHGQTDHSISYGLEDSNDISLSRWVCMVMGPDNTAFEGRFYSVLVETGPNYPAHPPSVQFQTRVNLPFVNQRNGQVDPRQLAVLRDWNPTGNIEGVLLGIKAEMQSNANRRLSQPGEGETY